MRLVTVEGVVEPGWEPVAEAFRRNFTQHDELGASVCVYVDGEAVVDLWGGIADGRSDTAWRRDTVVPVFSTSKGVTSICVHRLVERGALDLDAPVARYWPEFAAAGKDGIPVRWLLTHQAGLANIDADLTFEELLAGEPMLRALAAQEPKHEPGAFLGYHAITFGQLIGEVVRRATGRTVGEIFREELVEPLGLSAWIGLPEDTHPSLARLDRRPVELPDFLAELIGPGTPFSRAMTFGGAIPHDLVTGEPGDFNDRRLLAIELPGANLVADARSLARLYAATVGEVDGVRLLGAGTVDSVHHVQTADVPFYGWPEELAAFKPMDFALGFQKLVSPLSERSFGHGGAGGSLAFADIDHRLGFGYAMNRLDATSPDTRAVDLVAAVRESLGA